MDIIRAGQAKNGAYAACASFSQYGYSWLRDGTWIAYAMDQVGEHDSAAAFHRWAVRTLLQYRDKADALLVKLELGEHPAETDYLPTRFQLDGRLGQEAWTDFQLDGYGTWLWGLCQHCKQTDMSLWQEARPAIEIVIRYLEALWQSPNYDCWEEFRDHIHTATLAALYGGLAAVREVDATIVPENLPEQIRDYALDHCVSEDGHFVKFIGNEAVDASLLWVAVPYKLVRVNDPHFQATLAKIEQDIHRSDGGVYRYKADTYYGGGEWLLLTAWLGWVYIELKQIDSARQLFNWVETQARPQGELAEQVSDHLCDESYYKPWVERWGNPACPLLWSHAMYLILETQLKAVEA